MSAPESREGHPRVLIIRPTALGDVSRTVPALVTLRRGMPLAHIDWLVRDEFADVIRSHPDLNGIIGFPRSRFASVAFNPRVASETLAWFGDLHRRRYDLVIDLQGLLRSGLFTWITRAPRRVGYAGAREFGWLGYNSRHRIDAIHAVDRMLGLLEAEGFTPRRDMRLYLSAQDQVWLGQFLESHDLLHEPYFTIAPTARWLCKCWPLDYWAQIVRRLLKSQAAGRKLVLIASPHEREQVQPLLDSLGPDAPLIFPETTVGQMMAILSRTRCCSATTRRPCTWRWVLIVPLPPSSAPRTRHWTVLTCATKRWSNHRASPAASAAVTDGTATIKP